METCKNCLHYEICTFHIMGNENEKCPHYTPTADVVPKSEVERLQIEIQALNMANEKMYIASKESKAEVVKEIISIIEQRDESNDEQACGVRSEILSALYRGKKDAYRDIKEILEKKYTDVTDTNDGRKTDILKEFAERVKLEFYREFDEIIPSIMADKIDGIVKEITGE